MYGIYTKSSCTQDIFPYILAEMHNEIINQLFHQFYYPPTLTSVFKKSTLDLLRVKPCIGSLAVTIIYRASQQRLLLYISGDNACLTL
jgi:hypothetical protein